MTSNMLLLTRSDDVNTLGAVELRHELGHDHVYRLGPHPHEPDLLPPSPGAADLRRRLAHVRRARAPVRGRRASRQTAAASPSIRETPSSSSCSPNTVPMSPR
jgi:hypothetical protein